MTFLDAQVEAFDWPVRRSGVVEARISDCQLVSVRPSEQVSSTSSTSHPAVAPQTTRRRRSDWRRGSDPSQTSSRALFRRL